MAQALSAAHIEVDKTPEIEAIPLPLTGLVDPCYCFFGAPSIQDNYPHAGPFPGGTRERAVHGWQNHVYSVKFTPINLFAIRKVERVKLPERLEYSLGSFGLSVSRLFCEVTVTSTLHSVDIDLNVCQKQQKEFCLSVLLHV